VEPSDKYPCPATAYSLSVHAHLWDLRFYLPTAIDVRHPRELRPNHRPVVNGRPTSRGRSLAIFELLSSKDSPDDSPDVISTTRTKGVPPGKAVIADPDIPQYSDAMKEAWSAANAELPRAQGVEKFLNRIGMLVLVVSAYAAIEC
jgi:hypothetical protein